MLLCCFREPKEAKKRPKGRLEPLDEEPSAVQLIGVKKANTSQTRPLKTPVTPSSLSSNTDGEVLLASVTYHGQPQQIPTVTGNRYRHGDIPTLRQNIFFSKNL